MKYEHGKRNSSALSQCRNKYNSMNGISPYCKYHGIRAQIGSVRITVGKTLNTQMNVMRLELPIRISCALPSAAPFSVFSSTSEWLSSSLDLSSLLVVWTGFRLVKLFFACFSSSLLFSCSTVCSLLSWCCSVSSFFCASCSCLAFSWASLWAFSSASN